MSRRDGVFAAFSAAMVTVAVCGASLSHSTVPGPPQSVPGLRAQVAWLCERESAVGDWQSVRPPLGSGDEVQLTVQTDQDADLYVVSESDGARRLIFPAPGGSPYVRAGWSYALPGPHATWRLDGAAHDRLFAIVSRHPLADPIAALDGARAQTRMSDLADLPLPLRDGRAGAAPARAIAADEIAVDKITLR